MNLIERVYHQRIEFLRRNIKEPDILLVLYGERHRLLGEIADKYSPITLFPDRVTLMGMRLIYVEGLKEVTVALTADQLVA